MDKYMLELESFFDNKVGVMSPETASAYTSDKMAVFYSSKEDDMILAQSAPPVIKFLKKDTKKHYTNMKMYLDDLGIEYIEDHTLFFSEGFYTHTIWQIEDAEGNIIAS